MAAPYTAAPVLSAVGVVYEVDGARLLDGVSLCARQGEFVGLVGPNGAGKTTLLRTVSGVLRRSAGSVALEGRDLDSLSAGEVARTVAHVPQDPADTHGFTAVDVVLMGRYPHLGRFQVEGPEDQRIAHDAMRRTGIERLALRRASTLSGGERQRLFIARALAQEPRLLLLDEPTANLDVKHQLTTLDLVRSLARQGMTAVAAMHDLSLAARYCDRLVLLHSGRLVAEGPPEDVLTPRNIRGAFGVEALVYREPLTRTLSVSLLHQANGQGGPPPGATVHVICGGGSGASVMFLLRAAGFRVTAGVLGAGDTDRMAAETLGVEHVPSGAFEPIGEEAHRRHLALVAAADCTVLCGMPVSHHNLLNLEAARRARLLVYAGEALAPEHDFTGGDARAVFDSLHAAATCRRPEDTPDAVARALDPGDCSC